MNAGEGREKCVQRKRDTKRKSTHMALCETEKRGKMKGPENVVR